MLIPDLTAFNRRPFEQNRLRNFDESRRGVLDVATRPVRAFVEFTTRCPHACPHCYRTVSVHRNQWMSADMSDAILAELERELLPWVFYLLISGTGELFAAERWQRYLEAVARFPCFKEVVTSGSLLGPEQVRALQGPNMIVSVSMDGTSQKSYDLYRGGAVRADVVAGVDRLVAAIGGDKVKINCTIMAGNVAELPDMVTFCAERGIRSLDLAPLQITEPQVADEAVDLGSPEVQAILTEAVARARAARVNLGLPGGARPSGVGSTRFHDDGRRLRNTLRRAFRHDPNHTYLDTQRCTEPWNTILVNVFGDVAPCSVREPVGYLHREGLVSIWNGEGIRRLRGELLAGRSPGRCATCAKNPALVKQGA